MDFIKVLAVDFQNYRQFYLARFGRNSLERLLNSFFHEVLLTFFRSSLRDQDWVGSGVYSIKRGEKGLLLSSESRRISQLK